MTKEEVEKRAEEYAEAFKTGEWFETLRKESYTKGAIEISNAQLDEALKMIGLECDHQSGAMDELRPLDQDKVKATLESLKYLKKQILSLKLT